MTKMFNPKIILTLILLMGILLIYFNLAIVPAQAIQGATYLSFQETLSGQTNSKYAVINNSNIQINTIHNETAPCAVTSAKMVRDSQKMNFIFSKLCYFNWGDIRIMYKNENTLNLPPEIVPFPYGVGYLSNFNGLFFYTPDAALGPNDEIYVASLARNYSQGQMIDERIMISKRSANGWGPAVTLLQLPSLSPMRDVSLRFDGGSNGHLFYQRFTNSSCFGANCPRAVYELVFSPSTFNVISNTKIMDFVGLTPEVFSLKALQNSAGRYYNGLGFLNFVDSSMPYNLYVQFSKSGSNGWSSQPLTVSVVSPLYIHATSLDLELDSDKNIQFVASEKNIQVGVAKISLFTSTNSGQSWTQSTILSSSTDQYRDVNLITKNRGKNKEFNIAYTKANFGNVFNFNQLYIIKRSARGTQVNTLVYQNPIGADIFIGDLLV